MKQIGWLIGLVMLTVMVGCGGNGHDSIGPVPNDSLPSLPAISSSSSDSIVGSSSSSATSTAVASSSVDLISSSTVVGVSSSSSGTVVSSSVTVVSSSSSVSEVSPLFLLDTAALKVSGPIVLQYGWAGLNCGPGGCSFVDNNSDMGSRGCFWQFKVEWQSPNFVMTKSIVGTSTTAYACPSIPDTSYRIGYIAPRGYPSSSELFNGDTITNLVMYRQGLIEIGAGSKVTLFVDKETGCIANKENDKVYCPHNLYDSLYEATTGIGGWYRTAVPGSWFPAEW